MDDTGKVEQFLAANALTRIEVVKRVGRHEPGERGIMPLTRALELIESGAVRALENDHDGRPRAFFVSQPIPNDIRLVVE